MCTKENKKHHQTTATEIQELLGQASILLEEMHNVCDWVKGRLSMVATMDCAGDLRNAHECYSPK